MAHAEFLKRMPQIMQRFQRVLDMPLTVDGSGNGYQVRLPGFSYQDLDRAGYVSTRMLNRRFDLSRFLDCGGVHVDRPGSSVAFYVLASHVTCHAALYQRAAASLPMVLDCYKLRVGNSSYDICQELYDEREWIAARSTRNVKASKESVSTDSTPSNDNVRRGCTTAIQHAPVGDSNLSPTKKPTCDRSVNVAANASGVEENGEAYNINRRDGLLVSRIIRMVNFDQNTRKVAPIPTEDRAILASNIDGNWGPLRGRSDLPLVNLAHLPPLGSNSFSCTLTVRFADLDHRFHSNQGAFLLYALECAAGAAAARCYKDFGDVADICFRPMQSALNLHSAEALQGDKLDVTTWQDPNDPCALCFVIKRGEETVYRSRVMYHPPNLL